MYSLARQSRFSGLIDVCWNCACQQVNREEPQEGGLYAVTVVLVGRVAGLELHLARNHAVGKDFGVLVEKPVLVDERCNAAVCKPCGGHAVLDGAVTHEVQVLG